MPTIGVKRDILFQKLGRTYTDEEFDVLCFEYGIELDDVTTEKEILKKESGGQKPTDEASEEWIYKIDIPANRYDMLCVEGIARALNIFRGTIPSPQYKLADMTGKAPLQMIVKAETSLIRPFVVCAVLRGVKLNAASYNSFIDLQDKLHQNLCRQRTLVAIGTHDLSTIQGPFTYEALPPDEIKFIPLKQTKEFKANDLMQHYLDHDLKLRKFVPILKDSLVYPVIYDANRTVLSLPPIINGAHSAISLNTRDIFIECTATDLTKAKVVLNTVVTMFSEYCERPFEVEPVQVIDAFGESCLYPDVSCKSMDVSLDYINRCLGLDLSSSSVESLLKKMQIEALPPPSTTASGQLTLSIPPTRSDVLHACDVMEDVAIAYGYNNLTKHIPATVTQGKELPMNQLTEMLRQECAMAGYTEVLTWALCSKAENFDFMRRVDDGKTAVEIGNPATIEFEVVRSSLLPSALKTLGANKDAPLPVKLFEVSDVVHISSSHDVGARNDRHLVAVVSNREAAFEVIHGMLNRVMEALGVPLDPKLGGEEGGAASSRCGGTYEWEPSNDPAFFPGRQAKVMALGREVGFFGVVHPEVLEKFEIPYPVSALEISLEPFCFDQFGKPLN